MTMRPRPELCLARKWCATARPRRSAISGVIGSKFARPRTPSVPKSLRAVVAALGGATAGAFSAAGGMGSLGATLLTLTSGCKHDCIRLHLCGDARRQAAYRQGTDVFRRWSGVDERGVDLERYGRVGDVSDERRRPTNHQARRRRIDRRVEMG